MDWNSYHRLEDIYGYLNYLADSYPNLVQLVSIGSSYEGRPLYVVRVSSSSSGSKPAVWVDGGIHAREWISPAVATYILQQLVEVPANQRLLLDVDWYIMPVMNPDGMNNNFRIEKRFFLLRRTILFQVTSTRTSITVFGVKLAHKRDHAAGVLTRIAISVIR